MVTFTSAMKCCIYRMGLWPILGPDTTTGWCLQYRPDTDTE